MKMSDILNNNDVVLTISDSGEHTYRVNELLDIIKQVFTKIKAGSYLAQCLEDGGECQVLKSNGGGWKTGKIRIRIEFIPDHPEPLRSPLDDLRAELK
jgi:hypothetical protein